MAIDARTGRFIPEQPPGAPLQQVGPPPAQIPGQIPGQQPFVTPSAAGFTAVDPLTGAPPTGLIGFENALLSTSASGLSALQRGEQQGAQALQQGQRAGISALQQGTTGGVSAINTGAGQGIDFLNQGVSGFNPFIGQGTQAGDLQAALTGALGPEAQREALANLPINDFLALQGELGVLRNASATGGAQGGNVLKELSRFNQGLASTSLQQQIENLSGVANRGLSSLQSVSALRGQQAGITSQAGISSGNLLASGGANQAAINQSTASQLSNLFGTSAANQSNVLTGTGQIVGQARLATGQQLASAVGATTADISNLQNQLGQQFSAQVGQTTTNQANLLSGTGINAAQIDQQIATLLANIGTGSATNQATLTNLAGQFDAAGILGQNTAVQGALSDLVALIPEPTLALPPPANTAATINTGQQFAGFA